MNPISFAGAVSIAILFATAALHAQSVPQPPATPPQTTTAAQTPAEQPRTERQGRTRRTPRASKRQPASGARGTLEQPRTPREPGPTRQELTITANVLGGYDDNLTAGSGTGAGAVAAAIASGYTAFADTTLDYFRGNTARSFQVESTGNLRAYPDYLARPAGGGTVNLTARTNLGQNLTVSGAERAGYEPLFTVFSPGASSAPLPEAIGATAPGLGLFERRSRSSHSSVSVERRWSGRDTTSLSYGYRLQRFDDDRGDNTTHDAVAGYRRALAGSVAARAEYGYTDGEYSDYLGLTRMRREHRIETGAEFEKVFSRRRRIRLSLDAGATNLESIRSGDSGHYQVWAPTGRGRATFAFSPAWSVEGGYTRDFTLLQGLTDEVYATDTAFLTTHGPVIPRTLLQLDATYSNGATAAAAGVDGSFEVYGASLQLRVALTGTIAASAGYFYYRHRFSNPGQLPSGFPSEYDRHAVRVGLTLMLPVVGSPSRTPLAPR